MGMRIRNSILWSDCGRPTLHYLNNEMNLIVLNIFYLLQSFKVEQGMFLHSESYRSNICGYHLEVSSQDLGTFILRKGCVQRHEHIYKTLISQRNSLFINKKSETLKSPGATSRAWTAWIAAPKWKNWIYTIQNRLPRSLTHSRSLRS